MSNSYEAKVCTLGGGLKKRNIQIVKTFEKQLFQMIEFVRSNSDENVQEFWTGYIAESMNLDCLSEIKRNLFKFAATQCLNETRIVL